VSIFLKLLEIIPKNFYFSKLTMIPLFSFALVYLKRAFRLFAYSFASS